MRSAPVRPIVLIVQLFLSMAIGTVVTEAIWPGWLESDGPTPLPDAASSLLTYVFFLGFVVRALRRTPRGESGRLGPLPTRDAIRWGILCGLAAAGVSLGCIYAVFLPLSYTNPDFVQFWLIEIPPILWSSGGWVGLANLGSFVAIVLLAPFTEEILFRGLLVRAWTPRWGSRVAIGLSSLLFATLHPDVLGTFVFALVLCHAALRFGSLWVPMVVHAVNNLAAWVGSAVGLALYGTTESTLREFQDSWWLGLAGFAVGVPLLVRALRSLPPIASDAGNAPLSGAES